MDKLSQISFFDSIADQWDLLAPHDSAKLRCITELCGLKEGARILDAACGTGTLEAFLLEKNPAFVLGVDFSPLMIEAALARCDDPRIELRCCDVMEITEKEFDCAIVLGAFTYFENRGSLIRQMHHLLSQNGRLMICNAAGRSQTNAQHQANAAQLAMPLPAGNILCKSLEPYFDVDIIVDSDELYIVSGIKRIF